MTHMPSGDFNYVYEHDDSNLISKITLPDGKYYEYSYDDLYRLTNEYALNSDTSPIYTNSYEYDLADNRTGAANGTADIYVLNALNQITEIYEIYQPPHTTFAYNFNGNLTEQTTSAGTVAMEYDYENRLVKLTYPVGGWTEFVYDALGRRLKTVEKNGLGQVIIETHYVYDGLNMIAELNGTDTLAAFFTHGIGIDDPLIMRYSGADYFYQKNHQNSVIEVDNISGGSVKKYKYDAFGNIKQETGPTVNRGFTYTSRERHSRSGLYYYRARWYSPTLGRFLTPDPLGHLGGVNLYAYVANNPINWIDPWGLTQQDVDIAVKIIKDTQKGLRFPRAVDPTWKSKDYGQYLYFSDTIKLNEGFLQELTDQEATELLDTLIHETLHANDPAWKQFLDIFFEHPSIYSEANRRTKEILDKFLKERKKTKCE